MKTKIDYAEFFKMAGEGEYIKKGKCDYSIKKGIKLKNNYNGLKVSVLGVWDNKAVFVVMDNKKSIIDQGGEYCLNDFYMKIECLFIDDDVNAPSQDSFWGSWEKIEK